MDTRLVHSARAGPQVRQERALGDEGEVERQVAAVLAVPQLLQELQARLRAILAFAQELSVAGHHPEGHRG